MHSKSRQPRVEYKSYFGKIKPVDLYINNERINRTRAGSKLSI